MGRFLSELKIKKQNIEAIDMTTTEKKDSGYKSLREINADLFKGAPEMTLVEQVRVVEAAGRKVAPEHDPRQLQSSGSLFGALRP